MNRTALPRHQAESKPTLTMGQRVTVFEHNGSWLDGQTGTVVALPHRGGLFTNNKVAVQIDGDSPLGPSPTRWLDPHRVAPVSTCETCAHGCECDGAAGATDCGHYACWGRADGQTAQRCPGADIQKALFAAARFARGTDL